MTFGDIVSYITQISASFLCILFNELRHVTIATVTICERLYKVIVPVKKKQINVLRWSERVHRGKQGNKP